MQKSSRWFLVFLTAYDLSSLYGLPIVFGVNQGDTPFSQKESAHFRLYYEEDTPHEADLFLDSLESAKPSLEAWFGTTQSRPIPVISSARTNGASFANLITTAIELQSMGLGDRDLAWHEYTHISMYRHFYNLFGPPGVVVHLPWMPAWYLEGLAEALSVSVGSDLQASIERYHARSGNWPSYDRIHNLYSSDEFGLTGYATAGSFTAWILRKGYLNHPEYLNNQLHRFFKYTMPWYYPLSFNPFSSFMPFDESLKDDFAETGRALYQQYQDEAKAYWDLHSRGPFFSGEPQKPGEHPWLKPKDVNPSKAPPHPDHVFGLKKWKNRWVGIVRDVDLKSGLRRDRKLALVEPEGITDLPLPGSSTEGFTNIISLFGSSSDELWWMATDKERTKLCVTDGVSAECPLSTHLPEELSVVGEETDSDGDTKVIWLSRKTHNIYAEKFELLRWSTKDRKLQVRSLEKEGAVLRVSEKASDRWALHRSVNRRYLAKLGDSGQCLKAYDLDDLPTNLWAKGGGQVVLEFYQGQAQGYRLVSEGELTPRPCGAGKNHISPLLVSLRGGGNDPMPLASAIQKASLWQEESEFPNFENLKDQHQRVYSQPKPVVLEEPAPWRPRPLFALPLIGHDDPLNYQLGVIGVPFMDEMQNETATLYVGVGVNTLYPSTVFTIDSTRFWPTLSGSVYHRPVWNGVYFNMSKIRAENCYLHESGVTATSTWEWFWGAWSSSLELGVTSAYRTPYLGLYQEVEGFLNENLLSASLTRKFQYLTAFLKLNTRVASPLLNPRYQYEHFGEEAYLKIPTHLLGSELTAGVQGMQMFGKKTPLLKEYYMPLTTFVPGTGGGYNQTYFNLSGDSGSLFVPRFGDRTARAYVDWSLPLIHNIDKLVWLLYLERLDFTVFYNYGGAWYGWQSPRYRSRFLEAVGYHLDLQMENKGVHFNAGFGLGQVLGSEVQSYAKLGFNAFL